MKSNLSGGGLCGSLPTWPTASRSTSCCKLLDAFGKVDIMVNAAGITKRAPTLDFSEADWNRIMDTNLTGTLRGARCSDVT